MPDGTDPDQEVKMAAALPKGKANGLTEMARQLVREMVELDRSDVRPALVLFSVKEVKVASGSSTPVVQIIRFEPLTDVGHQMTAERMLVEEYRKRTGKGVMEYDLTAAMEAAFMSARDAAAQDEREEAERESMSPADEMRRHLERIHGVDNARGFTDQEAADRHARDHDNDGVGLDETNRHEADWIGWTRLDVEVATADDGRSDDEPDDDEPTLDALSDAAGGDPDGAAPEGRD